MTRGAFGELNARERKLFQRLDDPRKIQDFLDRLPVNFEKHGDTHRPPRCMLREGKAHCVEGALLAAAALWFHGKPPLLLDLKTKLFDDEHVVALFKENGYWGAISKTNHAVVRWRDPVYRTVRELALSYFHEYFRDHDGLKTLVSYSRPFDLRRHGHAWITAEQDWWELDDLLNATPHYALVPAKNKHHIRRATPFERRVLSAREWSKKDPRT
ncbi:MAG: hypothetical protein WCI38_03275 [Chthoniobacterales bacterium]|jgi:hypothetical protein